MQLIINEILEIDPSDPTVIELARLAKRFDLKDMPEVVREVSGYFGMSGQKLGFRLDLTTYKSLVRTFLSAAIVNYAVSIHEEFFLDLPEQPEQMPRIYRTVSADRHREYADKYLRNVKDMIAQFEN